VRELRFVNIYELQNKEDCHICIFRFGKLFCSRCLGLLLRLSISITDLHAFLKKEVKSGIKTCNFLDIKKILGFIRQKIQLRESDEAVAGSFDQNRTTGVAASIKNKLPGCRERP